MKRSEDKRSDPEGSGQSPESMATRRPRGWRMVLLVGSMALMVVGGVLTAYSWVRTDDTVVAADPPPSDGTGLDSALVRGFLPTEGGGEGDGGGAERAAADPLSDWSPAVFRLGFSFFAAFCIAYAARRFLRIAIVVAGVVFVALFGLQYAGVIDVNWSGMGEHYDRLLVVLRDQLSSFTQFIQGYLPSTAMAALGLVAGFRSR